MPHEGMLHWNDNQMCSIWVNTTNGNPLTGEILEICLLALDNNLNPRTDVIPFNVYLKPYHPERIQPTPISRKACSVGHDPMKAYDLLESWIATLKLRQTDYGKDKKIFPLVYDWPKTYHFLQRWLGYEFMDQYFDPRVRDLLCITNYYNDRTAMHTERIFFPKTDMEYIASCLKIEIQSNYAISYAVTMIKVYQALTKIGIFA